MFGGERYHHSDFPSEKTLTQKLSKAGLINSFGWSMEYMITHVGLIVANPELYRQIAKFTEAYGVSPLGLIGRASIWVGRGLFVVAAGENTPDGKIKKGVVDLAAVAATSMLYLAACKSTGHSGMLIEKTFVDTVVVSAVSPLMEAVIDTVVDCCPRLTHWQFWRRGREEEEIALAPGISSRGPRSYGMGMRWDGE